MKDSMEKVEIASNIEYTVKYSNPYAGMLELEYKFGLEPNAVRIESSTLSTCTIVAVPTAILDTAKDAVKSARHRFGTLHGFDCTVYISNTSCAFINPIYIPS